MSIISVPKNPKYFKTGDNSARIELHDCYPGYGNTLGNGLRRVLLSSLEGSAINAVKIKGVSHEFSTIPGVLEDVVHIILNLKRVRFMMDGSEPTKVVLKSKGIGPVTAKDIKCPTGIKVINTDQMIATVTDKKAELEIELEITKGLGYLPVEQQSRENREIGAILIDAIYTPIRRVNYNIENMRVGKRTDYDKVTFEIETDGSLAPEKAFEQAVEILVGQFSALSQISFEDEKKAEEVEAVVEAVAEEPVEDKTEDPLKTKVTELKGLSTRTLGVLEEGGVQKVKDIVKLTEAELGDLKGMGEKGIKEIKKAVGEFGLTLKQE